MKCNFCSNEIVGSGKKYCSLSCANRGRDYRPPTNREVRQCRNNLCAVTFEVVKSSKRKFCSHSCAAVVNNIGVTRHGDSTKCLRCANPTWRRNKKYCSRECMTKHYVEGWLAGIRSAQNKYTIAEWARRFVFERAGYQCEAIDSRTGFRCDEDRLKSNGTTVLEVDHMDGNWQNSWPDNLRALCPTCHALTETYGAANMGNGRTWKKNYNQYQPKVDKVEDEVIA